MYTFIGAIMDHIIVPIIIALGAALLLICKNRFDKISKSIVAKNELADMQKKTNIRKDLMEQIAINVEAAVASNMQIADGMKAGGKSLTEEQVKSLNESAKQLVINALPSSMTEDDGVLLEILGGRAKLDAMIDAMMEKYVYEYKVKKIQAQYGTENRKNGCQVPTRPIRK